MKKYKQLLCAILDIDQHNYENNWSHEYCLFVTFSLQKNRKKDGENMIIKERNQLEREQQATFYKKRWTAYCDSVLDFQERGIDITSTILDLLEELGFDRKSLGAKYLEDVISTLFYERKVFEEDNKFFDFNDKKNNHYIFTREDFDCGGVNYLLENIAKAVNQSYVSDSSLNEIIYGVTNDVISQYAKTEQPLVYQLK